MFTFDTAAFEAALQQGAQQLVNASTLAAAAHAGAEALSGAIVTNVIAMNIVKSGRYRDSWEPADVSAGPMEAEAAAQSEVPYGPVLEYGGKDPQEGQPKRRQVVARPAGRNAVDSPKVHEDVLRAMAGEL